MRIPGHPRGVPQLGIKGAGAGMSPSWRKLSVRKSAAVMHCSIDEKPLSLTSNGFNLSESLSFTLIKNVLRSPIFRKFSEHM